jgi:tol-pal system protein YbgF
MLLFGQLDIKKLRVQGLKKKRRILLRMNKYIKFGLIVFITVVFSETEIAAQSTNLEGIVSKLNRLERDIQMLNRNYYKGDKKTKVGIRMEPAKNTPDSAYIIRMEDRFTELKSELQSTTNLAESINHNLDEIKGRLDKLTGDISFRLDRLEKGLALPGVVQEGNAGGSPTVSSLPNVASVEQISPSTGGPIMSSGKPRVLGQISEENVSAVQRGLPSAMQPGLTSPQTKSVKKSLLPKGSPSSQYRYALLILQKTNYAKAELAFKEFIQKYPKNKLTPNARYWLGETFYVRENYRDAAEAFLLGYQQSFQGPKAPDTLLKLGMSLANLNKKQDACATFNKLSKDFPDVSVNIKRTLKRQVGRAGCK